MSWTVSRMTKEEFIGWLDDEWNIVLDQNQPIVRCKDCRFYNDYHGKCHRPVLVVGGIGGDTYWSDEVFHDPNIYCTHAEPDGFCAWGEPREGSDK